MKNKNSKKYVIVPGKLHPTQIGELSMFCVMINQNKLDELFEFIVNNGGRVIAAVPSCGVSNSSIIDLVNGYNADHYCVFSVCQKEIIDILMINLCRTFNFTSRGGGKAFVIDILGYMGAKGPFVE